MRDDVRKLIEEVLKATFEETKELAYSEITNRLIAPINDNAYKRKEKLADTIALLI